MLRRAAHDVQFDVPHAHCSRFGCSNDISSSNLCSCCCCAVRVRMPLTCSRHFSSCHMCACPYFRFCTCAEAPLAQFALHDSGFLPSRVEPHSSIPSILAAGVVYRARTVKPSHMSPPRGQSLPAATHSEAVSYSCNAALAVGISFLRSAAIQNLYVRRR